MLIQTTWRNTDKQKRRGHCTKRQAVAACEDGGPEGRAIRFDDCGHTVFEWKTSGNGFHETDRTARQDQCRSVKANDALM